MLHSRRATVVAGIAVLLWELATGLAVNETLAVDPASSGVLQEAFRFRSTLGLPADPQTLDAAEADPGQYPDREFGVPLSTVEAAEIRRRIQLQEALSEASAYAAERSNSAGIYIDQLDRGTPVFLFVGGAAALQGDIEARLPPGTGFRIAAAQYTYSELLESQARVEALRADLVEEGIRLVLTGLDVRANRVTVGVLGLTPEVADLLLNRFGPTIAPRNQGPTQADSCSYPNCWPLKGGIEIWRTSGVRQCTSGFIVKKASTTTYGIITAGHCIEVNGGFNQLWSHGTTTVYSIGPSQYETWQAGANADVGIIHAYSGSVPTQKNRIYTPGDATTYRDILAVTTSANQ